MPWVTEGRKTNPTSGTVLADTGALETGDPDRAGAFSGTCLISCTVGATAIVQRRNAANDTTIVEQYLHLSAATPRMLTLVNVQYLENERVRIITDGVLMGDVQASLFY